MSKRDCQGQVLTRNMCEVRRKIRNGWEEDNIIILQGDFDVTTQQHQKKSFFIEYGYKD